MASATLSDELLPDVHLDTRLDLAKVHVIVTKTSSFLIIRRVLRVLFEFADSFVKDICMRTKHGHGP